VLPYTGYSNTMIGILTPLMVMSPLNMGQMIQEIRDWKSEQERTPIEQMIDDSLLDVWDDIEMDIDSKDTDVLLMLDSNEVTDSLLREVVGDDKNDKKRKVMISEDDEWLRNQTTGGGAET